MEIIFNNANCVSNKKAIINNVDITLKEGKINGLIFSTRCKVDEIKFNDDTINNLCSNVNDIGQYPGESFFCESVYKELEYWLEYYNYKKEKIDKHIKDAIKMVGLDEKYLSCDPLDLSSSEMQKVLLAKCLALNPKIFVFDEPTICLDDDDKKRLIKLLKNIKRRFHKTIIIMSQDIEFIHQVADYLFVFDSGKLITEGDKYEVFKRDKLLEKHSILIPKIVQFELLTLKEKNIKLGLRDELNDLIKDILRNT